MKEQFILMDARAVTDIVAATVLLIGSAKEVCDYVKKNSSEKVFGEIRAFSESVFSRINCY